MSNHEQVMNALQLANETRFKRAELKEKVAAGELRVADIINDPPPEAVGMRIEALLISQMRWGRLRTIQTLARACVPERKAIGALTDRQRRVLTEELD